MGYAIFAARKLMLTNRINNLNFRIMCLSQQQQSLSDISARMQEYFGNMSMMLGNQNSSIFQAMALGSQFAGGGGSSINPNIMNYMSNQQMMLNMQSQMMLKPVAAQENQIECERKRLETQLSAAQKELEKVEQAEEKQIQNSAPKYA